MAAGAFEYGPLLFGNQRITSSALDEVRAMKILLYIFLAWVLIATIGIILWSFIKTIWQRIDPKSWCLYEASGEMGAGPIEKLYRRYGEVEATKLLMSALKARMRQVKESLYRPRLDEGMGDFEKELNKFATLTGSAILGLRAIGMAEKMFPFLSLLMAHLLSLEPEKLEQTVVIRIPLLTQVDEKEIDNPVVETLHWALKELEVTDPASGVSFPPIPFTHVVKRPKDQRTS
jgi:hypothetical protein